MLKPYVLFLLLCSLCSVGVSAQNRPAAGSASSRQPAANRPAVKTLPRLRIELDSSASGLVILAVGGLSKKSVPTLADTTLARQFRQRLATYAFDSAGHAIDVVLPRSFGLRIWLVSKNDTNRTQLVEANADGKIKSLTKEHGITIEALNGQSFKPAGPNGVQPYHFLRLEATRKGGNAPVPLLMPAAADAGTKYLDIGQGRRGAAQIVATESNPGATNTPPTATNSANPSEDPRLAKARELFPAFEPGQALYGTSGEAIILLDKSLQPLPGVVVPACNPSRGSYLFIVIDNIASNDYHLDVEAVETPGTELSIYGAPPSSAAKMNATGAPIRVIRSNTMLHLNGNVRITLQLRQGADHVAAPKDGQLENSAQYTFTSCDAGYHVGIFLGFYRSTLPLPDKIAMATLANGTTTLVADNPRDQKALTVMAAFYPKVRPYYYRYRDLDFWEKWSVNFGTKLSQNLFDDFFLGLSYEFAKGGSFASGVHYGQHTTIVGYNNFRFGRTPYNRPSFDAGRDTRLRWDTGWYVGVNIDLRIIAAMHLFNREYTQERVADRPAAPASTTPNPDEL